MLTLNFLTGPQIRYVVIGWFVKINTRSLLVRAFTEKYYTGFFFFVLFCFVLSLQNKSAYYEFKASRSHINKAINFVVAI